MKTKITTAILLLIVYTSCSEVRFQDGGVIDPQQSVSDIDDPDYNPPESPVNPTPAGPQPPPPPPEEPPPVVVEPPPPPPPPPVEPPPVGPPPPSGKSYCETELFKGWGPHWDVCERQIQCHIEKVIGTTVDSMDIFHDPDGRSDTDAWVKTPLCSGYFVFDMTSSELNCDIVHYGRVTNYIFRVWATGNCRPHLK